MDCHAPRLAANGSAGAPSTRRIRRQFPAVALEIFGNFALGLSHASFHDSFQEEPPDRTAAPFEWGCIRGDKEFSRCHGDLPHEAALRASGRSGVGFAFYTISILELQSSHVDWYCRLFVWSLLLLRRSGCW
jgi:hypothetical protein